MIDTVAKPKTKVKTKTERPRLHKVILVNDDFTPREFVVIVLKAVFNMGEEIAHRVMLTAHQKGACVIVLISHFRNAPHTIFTAPKMHRKSEELPRERRVWYCNGKFRHRVGNLSVNYFT